MNNKNWISSVAVTLITAVITTCISFYLNKTFSLENKMDYSFGRICFFVVLGISIIAFLTILLINNSREYRKAICQSNKEIVKLKEEINNKYKTESSENNSLLLMALTQNPLEPLRYELLRVAYEEDKDVLAAIILSSAYEYGIKSEDNTIIETDISKSIEILESINDIDSQGITDWLIGFKYENHKMPNSNLSKEEEKCEAFSHYNKSAEKGFPKAFNSKGKFYHFGWAGLDKDENEAIACYKNGSERRDPYASVNCGLTDLKRYELCKDKDFLNSAEKYFKEASDFNCAEAFLNLGIIYEEKYKNDMNHSSKLLNEAKENYILSFKKTRNIYSAVGLFRLGCLIKEHNLFADAEIKKALNEETKRTDIICFFKAKAIFQKIESNGKLEKSMYRHYYDILKNDIENIRLPDTLFDRIID